MIELQQKNADKGFTILGAAMDDEGKSVVEPYVQKTEFDVDGQKMKMNYPILDANDREDLENAYGPFWGIPASVVIGRDGRIANKHSGLASKEQFDHEIKALM
jgi:hypothetical protein